MISLWLHRIEQYYAWRLYVRESQKKLKLNRLFRYIGRGYTVIPKVIGK